MRITWDDAKRQRTIDERGLDFADAARIWEGLAFTVETYAGSDPVRYKTIGWLDGVIITFVWTPRPNGERRIISMRRAHGQELRLFREEEDNLD